MLNVIQHKNKKTGGVKTPEWRKKWQKMQIPRTAMKTVTSRTAMSRTALRTKLRTRLPIRLLTKHPTAMHRTATDRMKQVLIADNTGHRAEKTA